MEYDSFFSVAPLVSFHNADVQKSEIIKEIKGKAGVYLIPGGDTDKY